jgi:excisionase family DNA binding protein
MSEASLPMAREASLKPVSLPPISLRPVEAARALGISPRTLHTLTQQGRIPHSRLGRCIRYRMDVIGQFLADHEQVGWQVKPRKPRPDADAARGVEGKGVSK